MKKLICCILAAAMLMILAVGVYATEVTTCTLTADSLSAGAGEEITVPVRIADNPGFTNFSLRLYYDPAVLTLKALEDVAGTVTSVNPEGQDEDGTACAIIVSASAEAVTGDCVLFNAVFTVNENASGTTAVTPKVGYIRNNSAVFSIFQELTATVQPGTLTVEDSVLLGDVNGDGKITSVDVTMLKMYLKNKYTLSSTQMQAADVNGDGKITSVDVTLLKMYMKNKLEKFPGQ